MKRWRNDGLWREMGIRARAVSKKLARRDAKPQFKDPEPPVAKKYVGSTARLKGALIAAALLGAAGGPEL